MSCAKMAEPLEMQFGMLSQTSQGNMYYMGRKWPMGRSTFGVSVRLKSIIKHRIWGAGWAIWAGLGCDLCKKGQTDLNNPYIVWHVLHKNFGSHDDCTCVKIFSGVNFL